MAGIKAASRLALKLIVALAVAAVVVFILLPGGEKPPPTIPPPAVTVAKPLRRDVTYYYDFTGNTEAIESAEVKARVEGFLKSIEFTVSSDVNEGDLLFTIEPNSYEATRDQELAGLHFSQAELERAKLDLQRVELAAETNAVSQQEVSTKKADRDKAIAAVAQHEALLAEAKLNLSYTQVLSPIAGRASRNLVDVGNLVGAGEKTLLTTVVRMDPMYVYFNISESILIDRLKIQSVEERRKPNIRFYIALAGDEDYPYEGTLDYIDNKVDPDTGTINVRGQVPNDQNLFYPGMFVRVRVPGDTGEDALLVHERAIGTDISGKYLLIVDANNIVEKRPVQIGILDDKMRVIEHGIEPDELYIVDGLQRARPGLPITAKPAPPPPAKPPDKNEPPANRPESDKPATPISFPRRELACSAGSS